MAICITFIHINRMIYVRLKYTSKLLCIAILVSESTKLTDVLQQNDIPTLGKTHFYSTCRSNVLDCYKLVAVLRLCLEYFYINQNENGLNVMS